MSLPKPNCSHGLKAYVDLEFGTLDTKHLFCPICEEVVCLNIASSKKRSGRCNSCRCVVTEFSSGKIGYVQYDASGRPKVSGQY
jgi:hypothetical protein